MSMHEVEDLVEWSILLIDNAREAEQLDARSIYANLFRWQEQYDTGFTHFRVIRALMKARFIYAFPLDIYPGAASVQAALEKDNTLWEVRRDPAQPWDSLRNPTVGYLWDRVDEYSSVESTPKDEGPKMLYFEAGSEIWKQFVDLGKLGGSDARPPEEMAIAQVGVKIMELAERENDIELARAWFAALFWEMSEQAVEALSRDEDVLRVRAIAKRMGLMESIGELDAGYGICRIPSVEDSEYPESASWWFDVQ